MIAGKTVFTQLKRTKPQLVSCLVLNRNVCLYDWFLSFTTECLVFILDNTKII